MALDPDRYKGLAGFRFALRRFLTASEEISRGAGVTPRQYQALLAMKAREPDTMAMKDLADELMLTHHAAVQLVDRLAKASLALRQPAAHDRRRVSLVLTPKGEALLGELAARHLKAMLEQEPLLTASLKRLKRLRAPT
jgi:DNA-binding MarR family transcriptional regulator